MSGVHNFCGELLVIGGTWKGHVSDGSTKPRSYVNEYSLRLQSFPRGRGVIDQYPIRLTMLARR
jgi:hypothetical protein